MTTVHLEDGEYQLKCPSCGDETAFNIDAVCILKVGPRPGDEVAEQRISTDYWLAGNDSECSCQECFHYGPVKLFAVSSTLLEV